VIKGNEKIRIGEAAKMLGVSVQTLRNWEKTGKLRAERGSGNQRFYFLYDIQKYSLDIKNLGLAWAASSIPPEIPTEYYCERPDRFTSRVAKMGSNLQRDANVSESLASLLTLIAGEIGDNSFAHNIGNWLDLPGVFYAYDLKKRIIVLADRGRGVKTTLQQVRPSIDTDIQAITVAFNEVISGRDPEKRGNGLKVIRGIVEAKEIGLLFRSGIAMAHVPIKKPGLVSINSTPENIRGTYSVIMY
jgi:hypothetical protein